MQEKSTFGLDKNVACTLTYALIWLSGIVFLLSEKKDKEVKFHAFQSAIAFGVLTVSQIIVSQLPFVGQSIGSLIGLGGLVLWLVLLVKTYQGEKVVLPVVGEIAEKEANK